MKGEAHENGFSAWSAAFPGIHGPGRSIPRSLTWIAAEASGQSRQCPDACRNDHRSLYQPATSCDRCRLSDKDRPDRRCRHIGRTAAASDPVILGTGHEEEAVDGRETGQERLRRLPFDAEEEGLERGEAALCDQ